MGMQLPAWVRQTFLVVTGDGWPEADEDALFALARAWAGIGGAVDEQHQRLLEATRATRRTNWDGPAAQAYAAAGLGEGGPLAAMAPGAHAVAGFVYDTGVSVQYMKIIVLEELLLLAAQIAQLVAAAPATGGASLPTVAALQRLGQLYAQLMQHKLVQTIMVLAVGEAMQLALDGFAQVAQFAAGTRKHWDTELTENAAIVGAVGGALGLAGQGALAGLMRAAKASPRLAGPPADVLGDAARVQHRRSVIGQSLGQVAAGAAHEYLTSGVTGAVTGEGWIGMPWDATAGATEGVVEGLTHLKRHLHPGPPLVEFRALPDVELPGTGTGTGTATGDEQTVSRSPAIRPAQSPPAAPVPSPEAPAPPTRQHHDPQPVPQHSDPQPVPQHSDPPPAAEPPTQLDSPDLVAQQPTTLAAVPPPTRDGAGIAVRLRGQENPHQQPATPVDNAQRRGDPSPVRRTAAGDQQPVRRLSVDAAQAQPASAHTVVTPEPQTQHVELFEITPDGAVHHVDSPNGESAAVPPAATPAQPPHPNDAPIDHLDQPPSPTAQPDSASSTQSAHPPATPGSRVGAATTTPTMDSTTAEDRTALRAYTKSAYKKLNRYLRDPVGFTETLRQEVTAKIDAQIQAKNLRVSAGHRERTILSRTRERAARIQARVDRLSEALHRMPPAPGRTYRRVRYSEEVLARYEPGYVVTETAFTSTSRHLLELALPISNSESVFFIIVGDNGRDISAFATYHREEEVLYDKGTCFRVISKTWREEDGWWIVMREVPASPAAHRGGSPVGQAGATAVAPPAGAPTNL